LKTKGIPASDALNCEGSVSIRKHTGEHLVAESGIGVSAGEQFGLLFLECCNFLVGEKGAPRQFFGRSSGAALLLAQTPWRCG